MKPEDHLAPFGTVDGELALGGVALTRFAARVGSTPFFAYDRRLLTERVALLRRTLPPALKLGYAVKANPMPALVQHVAGLVDALDVASAGEMRTALDTGTPAERVSFAGPGKTDDELAMAVAAGVTIELESAGEADRVTAAGEAVGVRPLVAVRVNPDFAVRGSGMRMGGGPQQFGVDAEAVPALLAELGARELRMAGFHVFAGSQNLSTEILLEAQRRTADLVLRMAGHAPDPITYVNLGGGFGVPYFERDEPVDLAAIGANLGQLLDDVLAPALPQAHVGIELGRFIVGECGVYVTRVVDRKASRGREYAVVDGGMHHQLAASGNLGQVIRKNYPVIVGNRALEEPSGPVTVVGCLCTPLDLLADQAALPAVQVGDLVVLFQAGAYGRSASPLNFLGHPPPVEVIA